MQRASVAVALAVAMLALIPFTSSAAIRVSTPQQLFFGLTNNSITDIQLTEDINWATLSALWNATGGLVPRTANVTIRGTPTQDSPYNPIMNMQFYTCKMKLLPGLTFTLKDIGLSRWTTGYCGPSLFCESPNSELIAINVWHQELAVPNFEVVNSVVKGSTPVWAAQKNSVTNLTNLLCMPNPKPWCWRGVRASSMACNVGVSNKTHSVAYNSTYTSFKYMSEHCHQEAGTDPYTQCERALYPQLLADIDAEDPQPITVWARNTRELVLAMVNTTVELVVITQNIIDWSGAQLVLNSLQLPVVRNKTLIIRGAALPGVYPVLDFQYTRAIIEMVNATDVVLQQLVVRGLQVVPLMDYASISTIKWRESSHGHGRLVLLDSVWEYAVCPASSSITTLLQNGIAAGGSASLLTSPMCIAMPTAPKEGKPDPGTMDAFPQGQIQACWTPAWTIDTAYQRLIYLPGYLDTPPPPPGGYICEQLDGYTVTASVDGGSSNISTYLTATRELLHQQCDADPGCYGFLWDSRDSLGSTKGLLPRTCMNQTLTNGAWPWNCLYAKANACAPAIAPSPSPPPPHVFVNYTCRKIDGYFVNLSMDGGIGDIDIYWPSTFDNVHSECNANPRCLGFLWNSKDKLGATKYTIPLYCMFATLVEGPWPWNCFYTKGSGCEGSDLPTPSPPPPSPPPPPDIPVSFTVIMFNRSYLTCGEYIDSACQQEYDQGNSACLALRVAVLSGNISSSSSSDAFSSTSRTGLIVGLCAGLGGAAVLALAGAVFLWRRKQQDGLSLPVKGQAQANQSSRQGQPFLASDDKRYFSSYTIDSLSDLSVTADSANQVKSIFMQLAEQAASQPFVAAALDRAHEALSDDLITQVDIDKEVEMLELIGQGSHGSVHRAMYKGWPVAVKRFPLNMCQLQMFTEELNVLGRTQHPRVVTLIGAGATLHNTCLLLELCEMSLDKYLYGISANDLVAKPIEPVQLPLSFILSASMQIAEGLAYLHPHIIHRDLKPSNVLMVRASGPELDMDTGSSSSATASEEQTLWQIKLSDFGLARIMAKVVLSTGRPTVGTMPYMAPECFAKDASARLTCKADIFSLGIVLWELVHGIPPWLNEDPGYILYAVVVEKQRLPIQASDDRCPPQLAELIQSCCEADPQMRPDAYQVVSTLKSIAQDRGITFN